MATKSDNKKQIEAIMGEPISADMLPLIQLFQDVAISTNTPSRTTQKNLIANLPNRCTESRVFDVSAMAQTLSNGRNVFRLTNFLCPAGEIFSLPINVVATPLSSKPFYLTVLQSLVNNGADVEITVFSWNANGTPAPNVPFNWRCRVEFPHVIL